MLTLTANSASGTRRRTLSQQVEVGALSLAFVVILLALVVSLIYLAHANRVATRGYIIKKLELEKTSLVTDNEIWQQQVSNAESLAAIRDSDAVSSMIRVRDARYLRSQPQLANK